MTRVLAVADDLSGAAEAAAELGGPSGRSAGVLLRADAPDAAAADVLVLDTHSRALPEADLPAVADRAAAFLRSLPDALRLKKVDSQLRGSTGADLRVWADRAPLVVAPALPALGRVVVDGVLHLPAAGRTIRMADLLPGGRAHLVPLTAVERGADHLAGELVHAGRGVPVVVDAVTDVHLDVLAAALSAHPRLLPVGSGGLAAALGRAQPARTAEPQHPLVPAARGLAVLVGSVDPVTVPQLAELRRRGVPVHVLRGADRTPTWREDLAAGCAVVAVDRAHPLHPDPAASAAVLVETVLPDLADHDLVLTGGETARLLLDALGETSLRLRRRVHAGAIVSVAGSGRLVATRPGGFGGPDSLAAMLAAVRAERASLPHTDRIGAP